MAKRIGAKPYRNENIANYADQIEILYLLVKQSLEIVKC